VTPASGFGGEPALAAHGITRRFPGVVANDHVDLEVMPSEIHALLGENGSGKTTLCRILTGLCRADEGVLLRDGQPLVLRSPRDASAAGIFMVQQHFSLVGRLSVAENVVLGRSHRQRWRFSRQDAEREVAAAAAEFDLRIDPTAWVWQLSLGEQQRVEILKALYRDAGILILDEPTTVLSPQECQSLFGTLRTLAAKGRSIIFISHKLEEVLAISDGVTVLRRGKNAGSFRMSDGPIDTRELARRMVGREIKYASRLQSTTVPSSEPALALIDVSADGDLRDDALQGASLSIRSGEIVGVAGIAGNGQRELAETIAGLRARKTGMVRLNGTTLPNNDPRAAIAAGLGYVPEDRQHTGLVRELTVSDNVALKAYCRPEFSRSFLLRRGAIVARTEELLKRFDVQGNAHQLVRQLSGGNAQKVLLARELSSNPKVLVVAAPTQGLDVTATQAVRQLLLSAAASGTALLLISEDLDEVRELSDRLAVMCGGQIVGLLERDEADLDTIGLMMTGGGATR
jgi:ABC-type uncharacterized transport system ATPase subunit